MSTNERIDKLKELDKEIRERYSDGSIQPIFDGAFDPLYYFDKAKHRTLWLMKEPYEVGERTGGWSFSDWFLQDQLDFHSVLLRGPSSKTWRSIAYITFGINHGVFDYQSMPDLSLDHQSAGELRSAAFVNIQKRPSVTGSFTIMRNITEAYRQNGDIIRRQIELLDPHIIICAYTSGVISKDFPVQDMQIVNSAGCYRHANKLIVDAYHPATRDLSIETYVNDILSCIRLFSGLFD